MSAPLIKNKSFSLYPTNWTEIKIGLRRGNQSDNIEELIGGFSASPRSPAREEVLGGGLDETTRGS